MRNLSLNGKKDISLLASSIVLLAMVTFAPLTPPLYAQTQNADCPEAQVTNAHPTPDNLKGFVTITPSSTTDMTFNLKTPSGDSSGGVPGVIAFCVFPQNSGAINGASGTTSAKGQDGSAWSAEVGCGNACVSAGRPGGNPSNIPYTGTNIEILTAHFGSDPGSITVIAHINTGTNGYCSQYDTETCYVQLYPYKAPPPPSAKDLTLSKDAAGSYANTYKWTITKDVDKTQVKQIGGSATFHYTTKVSHDDGTISDVKVTGTITVVNPNTFDVTGVTVADKLGGSADTVCTVTGGTGVTIAADGAKDFAYTCNLSDKPDGTVSNTATISWPGDNAHGLSAGDSSTTVDDITFKENTVDNCADVTDTFDNTPTGLGTICVGGDNPKTFTYSHDIPVPQFDCKDYTNTAQLTTSDTGTSIEKSKTVTVCGPASTGALTIGYWQNKNGQDLIKNAPKTPLGVCSLTDFLREYAPFRSTQTPGTGVSPGATCSDVATYVFNTIKTANAAGSSMNAILKAQTLATALDVYFSDPDLGGNKINAASPIGDRNIDLTMICNTFTTNPASCTGTYQDVSSAFGGATCLTVNAMLNYAASQSNDGGTTWYGNVKSTQELAKNAFDAINNQMAFRC